jgi:hypothetical protein
MYRMEHHSRDEYFAPTKSSRANESLAHAADDTQAKKQKPLLLLVEDNEVNLQVCRDDDYISYPLSPVPGLTSAKLLSTFMKKRNYEYDTAENGLKALQAFQNAQKPYDIVFMGVQTCLYAVTS